MLVENPPRERPRACAACPPFFSGPSRMLMAPHNRAVDEDMGGCLTALRLEMCPELAPNAAGFPAAETIVHGIPMATLRGQIPPGEPGASEIEDRFDELAVAQLRRTSGFVFQRGENRSNLSPSGIREERANGHWHGPPCVGQRGNRTPKLWIRQQNLVFQRKILGVLALFSREPFSEQDSSWIGIFANQAAVALANAQAFEEIARGDAALRERANLLDLTHDTVFVRDINDVISFWNRGAEKLYGWTRDEAVGQVSHHLMQTIFPAPLAEITAELNSTGRWEAELIQTRRDGTQVVVASRWALQLDARGKPVTVLESNHHITERKRAEEALHKARAELAHVTRLATLGEMTASLAHEVNQPLAAVITNANACLRW